MFNYRKTEDEYNKDLYNMLNKLISMDLEQIDAHNMTEEQLVSNKNYCDIFNLNLLKTIVREETKDYLTIEQKISVLEERVGEIEDYIKENNRSEEKNSIFSIFYRLVPRTSEKNMKISKKDLLILVVLMMDFM